MSTLWLSQDLPIENKYQADYCGAMCQTVSYCVYYSTQMQVLILNTLIVAFLSQEKQQLIKRSLKWANKYKS